MMIVVHVVLISLVLRWGSAAPYRSFTSTEDDEQKILADIAKHIKKYVDYKVKNALFRGQDSQCSENQNDDDDDDDFASDEDLVLLDSADRSEPITNLEFGTNSLLAISSAITTDVKSITTRSTEEIAAPSITGFLATSTRRSPTSVITELTDNTDVKLISTTCRTPTFVTTESTNNTDGTFTADSATVSLNPNAVTAELIIETEPNNLSSTPLLPTAYTTINQYLINSPNASTTQLTSQTVEDITSTTCYPSTNVTTKSDDSTDSMNSQGSSTITTDIKSVERTTCQLASSDSVPTTDSTETSHSTELSSATTPTTYFRTESTDSIVTANIATAAKSVNPNTTETELISVATATAGGPDLMSTTTCQIQNSTEVTTDSTKIKSMITSPAEECLTTSTTATYFITNSTDTTDSPSTTDSVITHSSLSITTNATDVISATSQTTDEARSETTDLVYSTTSDIEKIQFSTGFAANSVTASTVTTEAIKSITITTATHQPIVIGSVTPTPTTATDDRDNKITCTVTVREDSTARSSTTYRSSTDSTQPPTETMITSSDCEDIKGTSKSPNVVITQARLTASKNLETTTCQTTATNSLTTSFGSLTVTDGKEATEFSTKFGIGDTVTTEGKSTIDFELATTDCVASTTGIPSVSVPFTRVDKDENYKSEAQVSPVVSKPNATVTTDSTICTATEITTNAEGREPRLEQVGPFLEAVTMAADRGTTSADSNTQPDLIETPTTKTAPASTATTGCCRCATSRRTDIDVAAAAAATESSCGERLAEALEHCYRDIMTPLGGLNDSKAVYVTDNSNEDVQELYLPILKISRKNKTVELADCMKKIFAQKISAKS